MSESQQSQPAKPAGGRCSGQPIVPYNPGLQQLVAEKQRWNEPRSDSVKARGFLGWHQRGYLPHYDAPGMTQLLTFRLHDALPASRRGEWEALLKIEDDRERRAKLEAYLDRGLGDCWLRQPRVGELAENALRFFDGERCQLRGWVVMPNHVHALVEIWQVPLTKLANSWKGFVAHAANRLLGRNGTFWQRDYWDTRIRDEAHLRKAANYVEWNPVKAKLVRAPIEWPWSSAQFRDAWGALRLPGRSAAVPAA